MIKSLEISHLKLLDTLFKYRNLSLVAENLDISQQAVSLQLKKIRTMLGDALFVRSGHGMVPTSYAKLIEPKICEILILLNEMPAPDSIDFTKSERTLVISATDYAQTLVTGELVADLREYAPKIKVIIKNIESTTLTQKMHQGEIDLAFTSEGYVPSGLIARPLATERYLCISSNREISFENYLPIRKLMDYDFVVTSPGVGSFRGSADGWLEKQGLKRNVAISTPSFFITKEYLKKTNMVGFIPSRLLPCEGLYEIPLDKYPPGYEIVAAFHPSAESDPLISWVLEKAVNYLS
ncbi:LysR family transcriptional regulator [Microbulbifer sp. MLAF003]|uniref:LysR family transcriptional regulator n=1 Tax=unclassified Microbulbifer TaxID=2619833 RepID=UPI0024AE31AA|nr:LysR family transcriptional regulator [Microbulbifer sp. MLAF003]WHI51438.1 LysR family transcriptional regulator [Microbulbifer sp. MLAF003]